MEDQLLRIDEMYAFVCTDKSGDEGIPALKMGDTFMPLVGADMERIEILRPHAEAMAKTLGVPIRICKFTNREELEVIDP